MHIFQELKTLISHIYFKTIVIDNLHLFRKWRGSSPMLLVAVNEDLLVDFGDDKKWSL